MIGKRYLNKRLQAAIDQRKPLWWEFGEYGKYYEGLKLIAYTGYAENGHVYKSAVFCTNSLKGAIEICEILFIMGIEHNGWDEAALEFHMHQRHRRKG